MMNYKMAAIALGLVIPTALACRPTEGETKIEPKTEAKIETKIETKKGENVPVRNEAPKREKIEIKSLPAPFATPAAKNDSHLIARPDDAALTVPPGFTIKEWATNLNNPRMIRTAPNGDVFIAESGPNRVIVLHDNGDNTEPTKTVFAANLKQPFGIAFYPAGSDPKYVYIANTDSVVRFPYKNGDTTATGEPETIVNDLPGGGYNQHWTRSVIVRPDNKKIYVSVGSKSNVGEEEEKRAAILEYNPDGTGFRVFASGTRNPVGLAFNPINKSLWTAVNERDNLGDDLVPDYATEVKDGGFYGWPYYYMGRNHDPRMPEKPELKAREIDPDVPFRSHVAALGIDFYTGTQFPAEYRNQAFVAQHGSWNRAQKSGYAVVRVPIGKNGKAEGGWENFVTGWALPDGRVWGRPVAVAFTKDGSMLITDDGGNKVWKVSYEKK